MTEKKLTIEEIIARRRAQRPRDKHGNTYIAVHHLPNRAARRAAERMQRLKQKKAARLDRWEAEGRIKPRGARDDAGPTPGGD